VGNVFDFLLAEVMELGLHAIAHLTECVIGERDAARLGQRFEPRRDIDAVSIDIVPLGDDVAEVHPHAEFELFVCLGRRRDLPGQRAFDGVDDACELGQVPVAHPLDDAAPVLGDRGIDDPALIRFQSSQRARLIRAHETRVAHHVCVEHRGEATLHREFLSARGNRRGRCFAKYYCVVLME
jgi:hypothetical protein